MISFKFRGKSYNLSSEKIEVVCLFGSSARGDNDDLSDVDLFVLIENCEEATFIEIKKQIVVELDMPSHWISVYRKSTFLTMHKHGSYFLWHLKNEGILLYSRTGFFEAKLCTLPAYNNVEDDLKDYRTICNDIRKSITEDTVTLSYELSVLASLVRNTCIAFTYLNGKMIFGRTEPVRISKKIIGDIFPFDIIEYEELYRYRIAYTRGENLLITSPTVKLVRTWLDRVELIIQITLEYNKGV